MLLSAPCRGRLWATLVRQKERKREIARERERGRGDGARRRGDEGKGTNLFIHQPTSRSPAPDAAHTGNRAMYLSARLSVTVTVPQVYDK